MEESVLNISIFLAATFAAATGTNEVSSDTTGLTKAATHT